MAPFRALTKVVVTLCICGAGTLVGQTRKPGKARKSPSTRSNLFSDPQDAHFVRGNHVGCVVDDLGGVCSSPESEDGVWPLPTLDAYIFQSGIQLSGLIPQNAGVWAGDTVGAFFMDFRGDQVNGSSLSLTFDSRDTAALRQWPNAAILRDTSLFAGPLLGRASASSEDLWTRYWDGSLAHNRTRKHPMGVVVDERVMQFNGSGYNADVLYLVYTLTNVTASDPNAYASIDPSIRGDYAALGVQFKHLSDSAYGVSLPASGIPIDSVFFNAAMDPDVGTDHVAQNYSNLSLPMETAFAYESPFNEPTWSFPSTSFGAPGLAPAPGLIGVRYLRYPVDSSGHPAGIRLFTNHTGSAVGYPDPVGVSQLYRYLSGTTSPATGDTPCSFQGQQVQLKYCYLVQVQADTRFDFTSGPFALAPGKQQTVVLAYLFAAPRDTVLPYVNGDLKPGFPQPGDSIAADTTKIRLIERVAGWVTQHDANADGVIDANEVRTWPGSLFNKAQLAQAFVNAKFVTPQAPIGPSFFLVPGDRRVTVVWQKSSSETAGNPYFAISSDPTTALYDLNFRKFDIEGYRIYRGPSPNALQLVAQFDYAGTEMDDYLGDFAYNAPCAPEFGVVTGCPAPFTGTPSPSIHAQHSLVGNVVQIPLGGRTVARNGAVAVVAADTAVTGGASGFPGLGDTGVNFSYVDFSPAVQNSFQYYYSVTAFTVNSVRSGPTSFESPRVVKTVTPRTGATFPAGTIGTPVLLSATGAVLNSAPPTLNATTGEFSGPPAPTQGLSAGILTFIPEVIDTGSVTLRVDSVLPGMNTVDDGFQTPTIYFLSSANSRGKSDQFNIQFLVDPNAAAASGGAQFNGAPVLPSKAVVFGADTAFALVAQATVSTSGTLDLTSPGRASIGGSPSNSPLTGSRWWGGAANENTQGPTDSLCSPASSTCALTASQLARTGGGIPGVAFIAPIQSYSTVPSIPQRDLETLTATVYRAADFNVYWGTAGNIDSVTDVTHGVPVPFDSRIGPTWGILDSTSFAGLTAADTPDTNNAVLTWSDIFCVAPVPAMFGARLLLGCSSQSAPLVHTAHLSTMGRATGPYRVIPVSQGPGFIFYLAGKFWLVSTASLPTAGTVWHARYIDGHIVGSRPSLTYTPAPVSSPAVPGLRLRLSYAGSSVDLTHTTDSALARVHTVPDPFYVTNALSTATDSQHIEFVHLPPEAIIRIYSVSGRLVALLTHNDPTGGGQEDWNVMSRDGKVVASGVYFYVVETADRRSKVGRFTVVTYRP